MNRELIYHIAGECVILIIIVGWFQYKSYKLTSRIDELESIISQQQSQIEMLSSSLESVIKKINMLIPSRTPQPSRMDQPISTPFQMIIPIQQQSLKTTPTISEIVDDPIQNKTNEQQNPQIKTNEQQNTIVEHQVEQFINNDDNNNDNSTSNIDELDKLLSTELMELNCEIQT